MIEIYFFIHFICSALNHATFSDLDSVEVSTKTCLTLSGVEESELNILEKGVHRNLLISMVTEAVQNVQLIVEHHGDHNLHFKFYMYHFGGRILEITESKRSF